MIHAQLPAEPGWFSLAAFPLLIRHFGEECLVFHAGAADTFVLDAFAGLLLAQLSVEPRSSHELSVALAHELDLLVDAHLLEQVTSLLSDLYGLGLIECR